MPIRELRAIVPSAAGQIRPPVVTAARKGTKMQSTFVTMQSTRTTAAGKQRARMKVTINDISTKGEIVQIAIFVLRTFTEFPVKL